MSLNPLAPVTNYQSMLNRICCFVGAAALGAVWLLREHVPMIADALGGVDGHWKTSSGNLLPIPGGYLLPALAVALASRVFRIHGRLSSWLGIRERFEIDVIIAELANRSDVDVDQVSEADWLEHRHDVMREAFYRFTSSRTPQIDEHLIHQALDLWSWFWIGLETTLLYVVTGLVLVATNAYAAGIMTIAAALLVAGVALPAIRQQCQRYAIAQVKSILSDPVRATQVQNAFTWAPLRARRLRMSA